MNNRESGMENRPFARNPGSVLLDRQQANADAIFLYGDLHVLPAWIGKVRSEASHAAYATHWLMSSRSISG